MLVSLKKRSYVFFLGTLKMLPIQIKHFEWNKDYLHDSKILGYEFVVLKNNIRMWKKFYFKIKK